jgi:transposase
VREAIEARGASLLYLPPYSPDLNPIELAFSKLKRLLRTAAARTADALCDAIGAALGQFTRRRVRELPAPLRLSTVRAIGSKRAIGGSEGEHHPSH